MTNEMRERVEEAIRESNGALTIQYAKNMIAYNEKTLESCKSGLYSRIYESRYETIAAERNIAYYEAVIEVLTETAESVKAVETPVRKISDIRDIRRAVATMANQLHRLGYALSNAFKTSWRRIKESMTCKVSGVTFDNRQKLLKFISEQGRDNLTVHLKRDRANTFDKYAVAVVVGIKDVGYAHIGYLAKGLAQSFAGIIDKGIPVKADIQVTGGYGHKKNYGALVEISIA